LAQTGSFFLHFLRAASRWPVVVGAVLVGAAIPLPVRETSDGCEPVASDPVVNVPVRTPVAVGVNVMLNVQDPGLATAIPQSSL
jgi:hypothetical protein